MAVKFRVYLDSVFHKVCVCVCVHVCARRLSDRRGKQSA